MDEIRFLHRQADECRRAANDQSDHRARHGLLQLAGYYEKEARRLNLAEFRTRQ